MLFLGLAIMLFVLPRAIAKGEVFVSCFGLLITIYLGYALITDVLDRRRNPSWHEGPDGA